MHRTYELSSLEATLRLGADIGGRLQAGAVLELVGDVGSGKTSFMKGVSHGLGISEVVQSPTFTISRIYQSPKGITLYHYDFYRLQAAGIMKSELAESLEDRAGVVALEWDDPVQEIVPAERTARFTFAYNGEVSRRLEVSAPEQLAYLLLGELG